MTKTDTSFRTIGWLLVLSALATSVGVVVRGATLGPPDAPVGEVMARIAANRTTILSVTYLMAMAQLIRIPIVLGLQQYVDHRPLPQLTIFTAFGALSGLLLTMDYIQWSFLHARLANLYTEPASDEVTRRAVEVSYTMFSYLGDGLGGNLGWLGLIVWSFGFSMVVWQTAAFPRWVAWFGLLASVLMLPNYLEFIANPPILDALGLVGQILINLWFLTLGVLLLRSRRQLQ